MTYELEFNENALKEWEKLDRPIREMFKKQLEKRLEDPHIATARLRGKDMQNTYKIKLRDAGYRLVYEVVDQTVTVIVLSVGKRDKSRAYKAARHRR